MQNQLSLSQAERNPTPLVEELAGALQSALEQISQMRGMFPTDPSIDEAVEAGEEALNRYYADRRARPELPGHIRGVLQIYMPDLIGDYDTPDTVAEWKWIEEHASFAHRANGAEDGVWEFALNLALDHGIVPPRLAPTINNARKANVAYVIFHQD